MLSDYDAIIREQLVEGVVEKAPTQATGKEFYIPHRPVGKEKEETTKLRVVYAPSLNEGLHSGPPLQNRLWSVLYSCSLTRGVYLELLTSLKAEEFIKSLKCFIARSGRPSKVYSDNGKTFVSAATWLNKVRKDEKFNDLLSEQSITWHFNLSRAPWWGGQVERLIGMMKVAFYKTVGQAILTWEELSEVILDEEVALNNRPLTYCTKKKMSSFLP